MEKDFSHYGKSQFGNFFVTNQIGVPHPYCIGANHVRIAADYFYGSLGKDAIEHGESNHKVFCETCKGKLKFHEHEQALLVKCLKSFEEAREELQTYPLSIKEKCEEEKYVGLAFLKAF